MWAKGGKKPTQQRSWLEGAPERGGCVQRQPIHPARSSLPGLG